MKRSRKQSLSFRQSIIAAPRPFVGLFVGLCFVALLVGTFFAALSKPSGAQSAEAASFTAGNADDVRAFLARMPAEGGTIRLKPGQYAAIAFDDFSRNGPVRLTAAEYAEPPVVNRISIRNSRNIRIEGLRFVPGGGETKSSYLINVDRSDRVALHRNQFVALATQPEQRVRAVRVDRSANLDFQNNSVADLERGFVFSQSHAILVAHNDMKGMTTDGTNFAEVEDVVIRQNRFSDFHTDPGQHPDCIQFWTNMTTRPSRNIEIANNVMLQGGGTPVQGVFMRSEASILYENVTIRDNILIGGAPHGITLDYAKGARIERNLAASSPITKYNVAIRLLRSEEANVSNNVTTALVIQNSPTAVVAANTILPRQNPVLARALEQQVLQALNDGAQGVIAGSLSITAQQREAGVLRR